MNPAPQALDAAARAIDFARTNRARFIAELSEFVRFPSVSSIPNHAPDMQACASWLAAHLRTIGLPDVRQIRTSGHPIVLAQWRLEPDRPTVLIYGHYDVQPADPLDQWHSAPFKPVVYGDSLHGRGASDDKGQMFAHVKALEAWLKSAGSLPVNVVCLFEGEEEIGSPNLPRFLAANGDELSVDAAVLSDMPIPAPDRPALTYAMRGSLSVELEVTRRGQDLHSGNFGGAVGNPLHALCEMVARLHDSSGRIAIPGFYRRVRRVADAERAAMARDGPSDGQLLRDAGVEQGWGEPGYTLYERTTIRPSLSVNGLTGGYQGPGPKAVIPAKASAKVNFRLVPDQDPLDMDQLFRAYIERITPTGFRVAVRRQVSAKPVMLDRQGAVPRAAFAAYRRGFGTAPVFVRLGGTIPVVQLVREILGIPVVMMGFALPGDGMHGPNEKFRLGNFFNGIATSIHFLAELGRTAAAKHQGATSPHMLERAWA
jgi:acetylornithine deacetylase/succinyl-diaminopimelate desuccinylase-like protein